MLTTITIKHEPLETKMQFGSASTQALFLGLGFLDIIIELNKPKPSFLLIEARCIFFRAICPI